MDLEEHLIDPDLLILDDIDASVEHEQFQSSLLAWFSPGFLQVWSGCLFTGFSLGAERLPPEYKALLGSGGIFRLTWADAHGQLLILRSRLGDEAPSDGNTELDGRERNPGRTCTR